MHRIGRTGRAGALGTAVSFACDDYVFSLDAIQKLLGRPIGVEWPTEALFRSGKVPNAPRAHAAGQPHRHAPKPARVRIPIGAASEDPDSFGRTKRKSRRR